MADKPVTMKDFQALQKRVDELEKAVKALKKSTDDSFDERKESFKLEKIWTHAMFDQHAKIMSQHAELINKLRETKCLTNQLANYDLWRTHFGESIAASGSSICSASVPEPSTLLLLGIGAISLLGYRKSK